MKWIFRFLLVLLLLATGLALRPASVEVPYESQLPGMPNGCEAVSLSMVSAYYMAPVGGPTIIDNYLDKGPIGTTDPHDAYVGDPYGNGYYAYPPVIARAAERHFADRQMSLKVKAPRFTDPWRLAFHLQRGEPVLVWITVDDKIPRKQSGTVWQLGEDSYKPYENLHVAVLDGISWGTVHLSDPKNGQRDMPLWLFLRNYLLMGMRAVIIAQ